MHFDATRGRPTIQRRARMENTMGELYGPVMIAVNLFAWPAAVGYVCYRQSRKREQYRFRVYWFEASVMGWFVIWSFCPRQSLHIR